MLRTVQEYEGSFNWSGCWQATYLATSGRVPADSYTVIPHSMTMYDPDITKLACSKKSERPSKRQKGNGTSSKAGKGAAAAKKGKKAAAANGKAGNGADDGSGSEEAQVQDPQQQAEQAKPRKYKLLETCPTGGTHYLRVAGFYSDLLYQSWHCATVEIPHEWLEVDNVDR